MGPDTLMTIAGRKTGRPRTVGVAVEEIGGRRFVVGTYGDVHWVRNLRAAGEAVILVRGRLERVVAVELPPDEAAAFFRDVLGPYIRGLPWVLRGVTLFLMRFGGARQILDDPVAAARCRPVFELFAAR
jgi:deazaflavin-dependent oxidoreductase (nitroreductase family)